MWTLSGKALNDAFVVDDIQYPANVLGPVAPR